MLAYVVSTDSEKPTGLQTVAMPTAGPKEALVRVLRAGVCNTDLEICEGYMGFQGVLGHEFVGVVEALGAACGAVARGRRPAPARSPGASPSP